MRVAKRELRLCDVAGSGHLLHLIWLLCSGTIFLQHASMVTVSHPTVSWQDCKKSFQWKNYTYEGCTTADADNPWCLLEKPLSTTNWGYCNTTTIPPPQSGDKGSECKPQSVVSPSIKALGCFKHGEDNFVCEQQSDTSGDSANYVSCTLNSTSADNNNDGRNTVNSSHSTDISGSRYDSGDADGLSKDGDSGSDGPPTGFVIGMILLSILLIVIIAVILVFWNRRRKPTLRNRMANTATALNNNSYRASRSGFGAATSPSSPHSSYAAGTAATDEFLEQPLGFYTVVSTYTPALGDELEIQPGDKVTILVEYDDGWVLGINETRGHAKGVFPKHCVEPINLSSASDSNRTSSQRYSAA